MKGLIQPLELQTCAATSPNSLEIYFRTGWWYLQTGSGLISGQKIKKKIEKCRFGALRAPFEPIYSASGVKKHARSHF